jgi:hypothetical protein
MHLGWVRTNRADPIDWKRLGYAARASGSLTLYSSSLLPFTAIFSSVEDSSRIGAALSS